MTKAKAFIICLITPVFVTVAFSFINMGESSLVGMIFGIVAYSTLFFPAYYIGKKYKEAREFGFLGALFGLLVLVASVFLFGNIFGL